MDTQVGQKTSVYEIIAGKIIEILKQGVIPWKQGWKLNNPKNIFSKTVYKGINHLLLSSISSLKNYSNYWLTFNQIKTLNLSLKKDSKGVPIVFWKINEIPNLEKNSKKERIPMLRYFTVFNLSQCDNAIIPDDEKNYIINTDEKCESIIKNFKNCPLIKYQNSNPYYSIANDEIVLPKINQFNSSEEYYCALFHELIHSTGHESRLNRKIKNKFGESEYSFEELVAELGSSFLCHEAGISNKSLLTNQSAYIKGWLEVLSNNPTYIIQASSKSMKAAQYILNKNEEVNL